jgi:hypothetical protein
VDALSGKVTGWVLRHGPTDRTLLGVLVVLADAATHDGDGIRLSSRVIATRARLSRSVVSVRLRQAVEEGWVERTETGRGGIPSSYRFLNSQGVNGVQSLGPDRATSLGNSRATSLGNSRATTESAPYTYGYTGLTGSTGRLPVVNGSRSSTPHATATAIAACELCDEDGWRFDETGAAARCDHPKEAHRARPRPRRT